MKTATLTAFLAAAAAFTPSLAHADDDEPSAPTWFGGGTLDLMPVGSLDLKVATESRSADTSMAWGFGGLVEKHINPVVSVGVAPRYVVDLKGADAPKSASQLDLRARFALGGEAAPGTRLYALASPGFSWMFLPDDPGHANSPRTSSGFVLGVGAGVQVALAPKLVLVVEAGYQLGFQNGTSYVDNSSGVDFTLSSSFLQLSVGLVEALD